ncbi:integration host factor, actinobacterial type [Rhodococcus sp. NPDC127530]|uniref:integration host factor, actinobacterial type n=1 Tax=unclassified Rhodococcus (in: high G+C Gram-positive bacteria) TaxID=192944 RepID=UPI003637CD88
MALPVLTPEQRAEALEKAAVARKARGELLSAVKAGELTVSDVLAKAETDEVAKKTKVSALVRALPGVGPVRAAQILEELSIAETRRIGGLGTNQRHALLGIIV